MADQEKIINLDVSEIDSIKIFGTAKGVNVVESPVKTKILSLLKEEGLNGSDIVVLTGKSKSTISAHLKDLINADIVDYKTDPVDGRKKIYYIKSRYLGNFSRNGDVEKIVEAFKQGQDYDPNDPFLFYKNVLRAIRITLMEDGLNIDPILHDAGLKVGAKFNSALQASETEKLLENIANFWDENKLGKVEIESVDPLLIRVSDCFECKYLPVIGRSACAFDSGLLEAVFAEHFNQEIKANEIKCYAKGDEYCCFKIDKLEHTTSEN